MDKIILGVVGLIVIAGALYFVMGNAGSEANSPFPTPKNVRSLTTTGENAINFQTTQSLAEVQDFYRSELISQGMTEREGLTVTSETTLSFVFDGHSSGTPLVVQAVALDDGTTNVNVRLENF